MDSTANQRIAAAFLCAATVALTIACAAAATTSFHTAETRWYTVPLRDTGTATSARGGALAVVKARVTVVRHQRVGWISWRLTPRGLGSKVLAAHVHRGRPGVTGPVLVPLCVHCASGAHGTARFPVTRGWFYTVWSGRQDTESRGHAYVDIHTRRRPHGEIRAQLANPNFMGWGGGGGPNEPRPPTDHFPRIAGTGVVASGLAPSATESTGVDKTSRDTREVQLWRVVDTSTDTDARGTGTGVAGSDRTKPVAARVRILAPRGEVSVSMYVECEGTDGWSTGGAQWRRLESRGRPIVRRLPFSRKHYGPGQISNPTNCKWVVSARGTGGSLGLTLEVRG